MKISVERTSNKKIITLNVEKFDVANMQEVKRDLQDEIEALATDIVLDFSQVLFVDSSGLSVVIAVFKKLTALDKKLEICNLQEQPMELIKITQLHKIFTIVEQCKQ